MNLFSRSIVRTPIPFILTIAAALAVGCGQAAPQDGTEAQESTATQGAAQTVALNTAFYDRGTQCVVGGTSMHCCPKGAAMIGAQVSQNVFKCAWLIDQSGPITLDTGTQRNGMHSCPFGKVMVGLRADRNQLACQTIPSDPVVTEFVDTGTHDGFPMHVCSETGSAAAMTGIRVDQDRLNCGENTDLQQGPQNPNCLLGACTQDSDCSFFLGACVSGCCTLG